MRFSAILTLVMILASANSNSQDLSNDSTILVSDTATIKEELFTAIYKTDEFVSIYNSSNKIVFKSKGYYPSLEFKDFDNNGIKDLIIN